MSRKAQVCEAGPPEPLPHSFKNPLKKKKKQKKTPPSICHSPGHLWHFYSPSIFNQTILWWPFKINIKIHKFMFVVCTSQKMAPSTENFDSLSIDGLIFIPFWSGASILGPLSFSYSDFCIPLPFMKVWKIHPCQPHTPVASNTWVPPSCPRTVTCNKPIHCTYTTKIQLCIVYCWFIRLFNLT